MAKWIIGMRRWAVMALLACQAALLPWTAHGQDAVVHEALPDLDLPRVTERGELVEDLRSLRLMAREQGAVPVIIGLRMKSALDVELAVPDRMLQRARIAAMQDGLLGELSEAALENVKRFRYSPRMAVTASPAALERLLGSDRVTSIEEDVEVAPTLAQSVPLINANKAWAVGYTGSGWAVAVLDTGVQANHPFLAGRVVHEACFSSTNATLGVQSLCPNGSSQQIGAGAAAPCASGCNHGTHVAGIAAGAGSSSGVARGASVIAIQVFSRKVTDCPSGDCVTSYSSDWMLALEHVYSLRTTYNVAAVNMSLGGSRVYGYCDGMSGVAAPKQDIDNLRAAGIATVIASGNDGYTDSIAFPSCISSAISVGSTWDAGGYQNYGWNSWNGGTSSADEVAAYSNSASIVDLLAPGSAIYSSIPGSAYASMNGTSMATPHVAGCWALLKQAKPTATVAEVKQALIATGVPVQDWRNGLTKPRIDCKAAMDRLTGTTAPVAAADLQVSTVGVTPSSVAVTGQISISASVRNAGTANAAASTLRYYRSTDATITTGDTVQACTAAVGALAPGAFASAPLCQVAAPAGASTYYYGVCVDAVAGESDAANNCSAGQVVTVTAGSQPDLVITSVSGGVQAPAAGTLEVSATVRNRGGSTSGMNWMDFYLSTDSTITADDIYIGYCDVSALAPDASTTCSGGVGLPSAASPGVYYIGAIVDSADEVAESNELNNSQAAAATTTITSSSPVASLGDGLDNTSLGWVTGGDAAWYRQTGVSYYGGDAVRAGTVVAGGVTYMQTTVTGPGTFSFYWKVSSEADYDGLVLLLDSQLVDYISGETNWAQVSLAIPAGSHTLTWGYIKDDTISSGMDTGWVDKAVYTGGGTGLFVDKAGPGTGTVTSVPAGIDCGADCSEAYATGTSVTLTAEPDPGYVFAGWGGDCSGSGPTCTLTTSSAKTVTATFSRPDDAFPSVPLSSGWSLNPADSDVPWAVSADTAAGGLLSLRSGEIGDGGVSAVNYTGTFVDGYVSFGAKVSSEIGYDYFIFMIDDQLVDYGSGEMDWTGVSYPIGAGTHTLTWAYVKDGAWAEGQDAAWIDSVEMPVVNSGVWVIDAENNGQPGRGFQFDIQNGMLAMALYGYLPAGAPTWYLTSGLLTGGTFTGSLDTFADGVPIGGVQKSARRSGSVGDVTLTFSTPTTGTIQLPGEAAKTISRLDWGGDQASPQSGFWVIDVENTGGPGRGFQLDSQGGVLALTFYGYTPDGDPIWHLATGTMVGNQFLGSLDTYTGGTVLGGTKKVADVGGSAGTVVVNFTGPTTGTIKLPGEDVKSISRLRW